MGDARHGEEQWEVMRMCFCGISKPAVLGMMHHTCVETFVPSKLTEILPSGKVSRQSHDQLALPFSGSNP